MTPPPDTPYPYVPFYCEENIWHLAQHDDLRAPERDNDVAFISNLARRCPLWSQRASKTYGDPVIWDYHVVLLSKPKQGPVEVWDLDTMLGYPVTLETWWRGTFPQVELLREEFQPHFRLIPAETFIPNFSTDRSHMRDDDGSWQAPQPNWPLIEQGPTNLQSLIDMTHEDALGTVYDYKSFLEAMRQWSTTHQP